MIKESKSGCLKHYCDCCGKLIYVIVPKIFCNGLFSYKRVIKNNYMCFYHNEYCEYCYDSGHYLYYKIK